MFFISEVFFDGQTRKQVEGRTIEAFSVFKKGIRPEWEDPENRNGSDWSCRKTMNADSLDQHWENMVLALVGEAIDEGNEICGCRVVDKSSKKDSKGNSRPMYRLELWLRSKQDDVAGRIKNRLLDALSDGEHSKGSAKKNLPEFEFKTHGS